MFRGGLQRVQEVTSPDMGILVFHSTAPWYQLKNALCTNFLSLLMDLERNTRHYVA